MKSFQSFRPKENNPPELNDFLENVLQHKDDFSAVREAARKYQKLKKDTLDYGSTDLLNQPSEFSNDLSNNVYRTNKKRNVYLYNGGRRRSRRRRRKSRRQRRHLPVNIFADYEDESKIKKRIPESSFLVPKGHHGDHLLQEVFTEPETKKIQKRVARKVVVEPEGDKGKVDKHPKEKKSPMNFEAAIHRTFKSNKLKEQLKHPKSKKENDLYYVDLESSAQKDQERRSDARNWYPPRHRFFKMRDGRPLRPIDPDYPMYEEGPGPHGFNDDNFFEKALAYEIEPRRQGPSDYNNPRGNNLYSVDEGRPENIQPFPGRAYFQGRLTDEEQPPDTTDERFFIDSNNNLRKADNSNNHAAYNKTTTISSTVTTSPSTSTTDDKPKIKTVKQVGEGFIEITKARREDKGEESPVQEKEIRSPDSLKETISENKEIRNFKAETDMDDNDKSRLGIKELINEKEEPAFDSKLSLQLTENKDEGDLSSIKQKSRIVDKSESVMNKDPFFTSNYKENEKNLLMDNVDKRGGDFLIDSKASKIKLGNEGELATNLENAFDENRQQSILTKNSLHPLKVRDDIDEEQEAEESFQSRRLKFVDEEMANFENQDNEYVLIPNRAKRDFLDALGMKNEEDYSEDNPYRDAATVNNTDINNDTYYKNLTGVTEKCISTTTKTTTEKMSSKCVQKQDMNTIKEILEEPKEVTAQTTVGNFKKDKDKKRSINNPSELIQSKEEVSNTNEKNSGESLDAFGMQVFLNRDKIYNQREDTRNGLVKRDLASPRWSELQEPVRFNTNVKKLNNANHRIHKKEDFGCNECITTTTCIPFTDSEIINSTYEQVAEHMDMENEKLEEVVNGHLASKIVSTVFDEMKKKNSLKTRLYPGLSRKHVNFAGTIDFDIFKNNETEDVDEARLLLGQIAKVLNKLVWNQVRRKLCQRLPEELSQYLEVLINVKNPIQVNTFEPNAKQGDFLFTYQEKAKPPFDVKRLQEILVELESLLLSYHNMNEDCQSRASPVKEYIEKHVEMLKQIVNCPTHNCPNTKRNTSNYNPSLIQQQLESVGLGPGRDFVPKFDLSQLIKTKMRNSNWKSERKRDASKQSPKYKKLQKAVQKVREKREYEKKIAELFGGKKKKAANEFEGYFEEPVVYSIG